MLEAYKAKLGRLPFFRTVEGFDASKIQVHFVDELPYQPWGDYHAKVWGAYNLYIRKDKYADAQALFTSSSGITLFAHECVHLLQIHKEGSFLAFAIKYALDYILSGFSYRKISYEREAYGMQDVLARQLVEGYVTL